MRLPVFLLTFILFSTMVSASCEENQIDINSASLEELDKLSGIGPVKAQAIIDSRPFGSVEDLINVSGIGEVTLENIKSQNLACVENVDEPKEEEIVNVEDKINPAPVTEIDIPSTPKETELQEINLNPKAIKSDVDSKVSGKRSYAFYGLIGFGILLGLLFLIKKKKYKNGFE